MQPYFQWIEHSGVMFCLVIRSTRVRSPMQKGWVTSLLLVPVKSTQQWKRRLDALCASNGSGGSFLSLYLSFFQPKFILFQPKFLLFFSLNFLDKVVKKRKAVKVTLALIMQRKRTEEQPQNRIKKLFLLINVLQ